MEAIYSEDQKRLVLFDESGDIDKDIPGDIYIDHYMKEIRLYNFNKAELSNKDKVNILYSILESSSLFPSYAYSKAKREGDIKEYVLLVNGYLLDGSFKEKGKKYDSIVTELIDKTEHYIGEPEFINYYRSKIRYYFNIYKDKIRKRKSNNSDAK